MLAVLTRSLRALRATPPRPRAARWTLRDPARQAHYESRGFAKLPALEAASVEALRSLRVPAGGSTGARRLDAEVSVHDARPATDKQSASDRMCRIVMPWLGEHLQDYAPVGASFMVKEPGPQSHTYPHQDWNFVDRDAFDDDCSAMLWIALGDFGVADGTLGFVPGSHRMFELVLGSPYPAVRTPTDGHGRTLLEHMVFPRVAAGEGFVFHTKCIHGTMPNVSCRPRAAASFSLVPAEAPLHHYYLEPGRTDRFLKLQVEGAFFFEYPVTRLQALREQGSVPDRHCRVVGTTPYAPPRVSAREMERLCARSGAVRNGMTAAV